MRFTVAVIVIAAFLVLFLILHSARMPLAIVSSDPNIQVSSVVCTFGTNHVYYHGDTWDKIMDPLITRLNDTNAYRLRCNTDDQSTVIWVRFVHPDYGIIPAQTPPRGHPMRFHAKLTDTNGVVTPLQSVNASMQHYRRRFYVTGWAVPGKLETHQGSVIRIESTNGAEAVTLRVP